MDYLGPPMSRSLKKPGDKKSSLAHDDVATVAFAGRLDLLTNYVRTETASLRGVR